MATSRPESSGEFLRPVTRRVRAPLGRTWWVCLVVLPLLLACASVLLLRDDVQGTLQQRVDRRASTAGWGAATFDVSGRDVTAHVPASVDGRAVTRVIGGLEGVRTVQVRR